MIVKKMKSLRESLRDFFEEKFNTLFTRIFVRFMLLSLIIIAVLGFATIYFFYGFHFSNTEREIVNNTQVFNSSLVQSLENDDFEGVEDTLNKVAEVNSGQAWLIDEEGFLIHAYPYLDTEESRVQFLNSEPIFEGNIISQQVEPRYFDRPMLLIGMPIRQQEEIKAGMLVFTSVAGINSTIAQVRRLMFYSSLLAIILGIILAYGWSRSLASPLKRLSNAVRDLSYGDYGFEIDLSEVRTSREMNQLQKSINILSRELDSSITELRRERNKLKHILTGMQEGVLVFDLEGQLILSNDSARNLLEISKAAEGSFLDEIIEHEEIRSAVNEVMESREPASEEFTMEKSGKEIRILFRGAPIEVEKDFWGVVGLMQDISERWRFEKLQQDFVANVSHELKAPLTSIKGSAEILLDGIVEDREKRENYLKIVLNEGDRLSQLVDEILKMAEYENESFSIQKSRIKLNGLLHDVVAIFEKSMQEENILEVDYLSCDIEVMASETRLKQVLYNLLDNARKFSPEKSPIRMGAVLENNGELVRVFVEDHGVGVPPEEQENIWERFYKVDKARTPGQKGSGLGLAICKQIVNEHNGEVFLESEPGKGSTFGFILPVLEVKKDTQN